MALFTDGLMSGMEDLAAQDTQLTNVANVEGIDVTQKLVLAQEELALEITALLTGSRCGDQAIWLQAQPRINNLVVTPALKLWHTFRALEMVYGDAYSSQLNDRYAAKRDQFHERAKWAYERLLLLGMGIARFREVCHGDLAERYRFQNFCIDKRGLARNQANDLGRISFEHRAERQQERAAN